MNSEDTTTARVVDHLRGIPSGIWALGFVSLLMDVSSEMIHALLPVYLVTVIRLRRIHGGDPGTVDHETVADRAPENGPALISVKPILVRHSKEKQVRATLIAILDQRQPHFGESVVETMLARNGTAGFKILIVRAGHPLR
jgi:hypothetical protein